MDRDPIKSAARDMRRHERHGGSSSVCMLCGYPDLVALIRVSPDWLTAHGCQRSLLEKHHLVGRKHDPELTVPLCRNCHAEATEGLLKAVVSMRPEPDPARRIALMLDALAVFREEEAEALRRWAELLRKIFQGRSRL